ncbi:MAG: glycine--tRNA ligase subunit beta [Woeseiaceae bacterium]
MSGPGADLLIELGTEELPPKALRMLRDAFSAAILNGLQNARLEVGPMHAFASPRRLAVVINDVGMAQQDRTVTQKGPPTSIAFDADGKPSKAGLAFAKKCGVEIESLIREGGESGEWLVYRSTEVGRAASTLIPEIVSAALDALPIPRRMRWGDNEVEFVRPVHWLVMLHGEEVVPGAVMHVESGRTTRGHRFQGAQHIEIQTPAEYAARLKSEGSVIADFDDRRSVVVEAVAKSAAAAGGMAVGGDDLYDEVAALTEWPVPVTGSFDEGYLALPKEVIIETLTSHQRYFPIETSGGKLLPAFVTLANLDSKEPERVRDGNERVIRPRLADAAFFWDSDQKTSLEKRAESLKKVVYQKGLGTLHDKSMRVAALASMLAEQTGADATLVTRAAVLAKCDLLTGMVGEFPELQGVMGRYYAEADGEPEAVSLAIGEQYLPRFAGDVLPVSFPGQVLAVADRLDTLAGVFLLGKKPTGNRDPFGLRRAALGVVRILIEKNLDIDFHEAVVAATVQQPITNEDRNANREAMYDYIVERMRGYFVDGALGFTAEMFESVLLLRPASLVDFHARLVAVADFLTLDAAVSLAAANKRTANILRKARLDEREAGAAGVDTALLQEDAERVLFHALQSAEKDVAPLIRNRSYAEALRRLAELKIPVDAFFDGVMVMAEDPALQQNRLALLSELRALFMGVADVSRLTAAQA